MSEPTVQRPARRRYTLFCRGGRWCTLDLMTNEEGGPWPTHHHAKTVADDFEVHWQVACQRWQAQEWKV